MVSSEDLTNYKNPSLDSFSNMMRGHRKVYVRVSHEEQVATSFPTFDMSLHSGLRPLSLQ